MRSLDAVFFAPIGVRALGLFRALYCGGVALTLLWESGSFYAARRVLSEMPELFEPIRLFAWFGLGAPSLEAFALWRWALLAALVCAAAGLATRASLTVSWLLFFLYQGTIYSARKPPLSDKLGYRTDAVILVLIVLSLAPGIAGWGIDAWRRRRASRAGAVPCWPLQAVKLLLAAAYLGGAYCKLADSALWPDGVALRAALLETWLASDNAWAAWLAASPALCAAASVLVIAFESTFWIVLIKPRLARLYVPAGLAMHLAMQALMDKPYFRYFILAYLAFLTVPAARASIGGPRLPVYAGLGAFTALQLSLIVGGLEAWPLSNWRFLWKRKPVEQAAAFRLAGVRPDGTRRWLRADEIRGDVVANDYAMRQVVMSGDWQWARRQLDAFARLLPEATARELSSVSLVRRGLARGADGAWRPVDADALEAQVAAR